MFMMLEKRHGLPHIANVPVYSQPLIRVEIQLELNIGDRENSAESPKYKQVLERYKNGISQ